MHSTAGISHPQSVRWVKNHLFVLGSGVRDEVRIHRILHIIQLPAFLLNKKDFNIA